MKKSETKPDFSQNPAPGVGDPASQDDNTTQTDAKNAIVIVSGPNGNQGGN
jgi:hypothetical protein